MAGSKDKLPSSPYKAYLEESRKPIVCLVFTLPIFIAYHIGVRLIKEFGDMAWVNGADRIIAVGLEYLGLGGPMISMFLVITVFLLLQQASKRSWSVSWKTLLMMLMESLIFALPPFLLAKLVAHVLLSVGAAQELPLHINMILSLGAGVYEEFLFRMVLMSFLFFVFKRLFGMKDMPLYVAAVMTQALLFSLFHHLPGSGEEFKLPLFAFRTLAGVYFAYIYQERGFGIAAGSHAAYDVIAVALKALR